MAKLKDFNSSDEVVEYINKKGFFVSSIMQQGGGVWHAGLRPKGKTTTSYGNSQTMIGALWSAFKTAKKEDAWDFDKKSAGEKRRLREIGKNVPSARKRVKL